MTTTLNPEANDQFRELTTDELAAVSGGSGCANIVEPLDAPTRAEVWNAFCDAAGVPGAKIK